MSVHKLFKKLLNESVFIKKNDEKPDKSAINEGIEADAVGNLTIKNIIPTIFYGTYHGLRVPSAVKKGKSVPYWDKKHFTYPFVGIYGCSEKPALAASHGREVSFIRDRLGKMEAYPIVQLILDRQVANGTGIPEDVFIMFPKMAISSAGNVGTRKSESLFNIYDINNAYSMSSYPYNVQQALAVDKDGRIYIDSYKNGGTVILPAARNTQMVSGVMLYLDKLTEDDLVKLAGLSDGTGGHDKFAREFTGDLTLNRVGGMLGSFMSGVGHTSAEGKFNPTFAKRIDTGGNPKYGRFDKFAKENLLTTDNGEIDFQAVREWIREAPSKEIVKKLIIPYILPVPFDKTYCWREVTPQLRVKFRDDIRLVNALTKKEKHSLDDELDNDSEIEVISDDIVEFDIDSDGGAILPTNDDSGDGGVGESFDDIVFGRDAYPICEAEISGVSSHGVITKKGYMEIFNRAANYHNETMMVIVRRRDEPLTRDDGTTVEGMDVKRTFARVLFDNTELTDTDRQYGPVDETGALLKSSSGTLDYSQIFEQYGAILDKNAPKAFKCKRLAGYLISFKYDPDIEEERKRDRRAGFLNMYLQKLNEGKAELLNEPTVFDVLYVFDKEHGNFIFTGYANRSNLPTYKPDVPPPSSIDEKHLYSTGASGLHSVIVHASDRTNVPYAFNQGVK